MSLLGVTDSAKGFAWVARLAPPEAVQPLANLPGLGTFGAQLLAARGIGPGEAQTFLRPRLRDLLPDPASLMGFAAFEDAFFAAAQRGETLGILADYDVDGATSAAVLVALLRALGLEFSLYVPDRLEEGYGPSDKAFADFARQGVRTVICLDCGSMAHGPVQRAVAAGLRVLIIDHHLIEGAPPQVTAHINPNQAGCSSGLGSCAAVGVCFTVMVGLRRAAQGRGLACDLDLMQLLDLVALGTVCDVVPLLGLNRAFVLQGLKVWQQTRNLGLQALLGILPKRPTFDGSLAAFQIGPRLNAAGRIGPSDLAARLLTTDDRGEAERLAQELDRLNLRRREIEANTLAEARLALQHQEAEGEDAQSPLNLVANPAWHPGVVGIVAGRLKDSTGKPSIVLGGQAGTRDLTGSGRSVPGYDLGAAVLGLRAQGVLSAGGGHAMAAGLRVSPDRLADLRAGLLASLASLDPADVFVKQRQIDLTLAVGAASAELAQLLTQLHPYGAANPEPKVAVTQARVEFMALAGKNHLRVTLADGAGSKLKGIAFRAAGTALETVLRQGRDRQIHVAGSLNLDDWAGGKTAQILIDDAALAQA